MAFRRALSASVPLVNKACQHAHAPAALSAASRLFNTLGPAEEISPPPGSRAARVAWLAGLCASAAGLASSSQAYADSTTVIPPEGKVTVQTESGKHAILYPAGSDEWRIKISPIYPKHEMPPKSPSLDGPVQLTPPPYGLSALEPHMSRDTLDTHWGKHHRTYAENANKQLKESPELKEVAEKEGLLKLVKVAWNDGKPLPVYNNAAQVANHTMFWESMKPDGGGEPPADSQLAAAIKRDFGSQQALEEELKKASLTQFGSGWAWLVSDTKGNLKVFKTSNAVNPLVTGWVPLLAIDVWEHAYYLDYKNQRGNFVNAFLQHLVDWEGAAVRYEAARTLA
nr:chloroplast iron superoxide dismutase 2 [Dunaliella salina]|mmetsp:Transcript_20272/g.56484  ORF Transcript_20272/g.56484 Transcript_20272/m.56484 type:complete len:340 (+) Transcript_20272:99-1118(+)